MSSQRETLEPSLEDCARRVFIRNFVPSINTKTIYDIFSAFGQVTECRLALDKFRASKGHGYVQYEKKESVKTAIEKVDGIMFYGKRIQVAPFLTREQRYMQTEENGRVSKNIYVDNFGDKLTDAEFRGIFEKFGNIISSKIMKDGNGRSKGFGFIAFDSPEAAKKAIEEVNGKEVEKDKPLYVARALRKEERQHELESRYKNCNLYVSNLKFNITDQDLRNEFSRFGTITSTKVMVDQNGRSKGFGFICFTTPEDAMRALKVMKGSKVCSKQLYVALAQKKEDRRAQLTSQYWERMAAMHVRQLNMQSVSAGIASPRPVQTRAVPLFARPNTIPVVQNRSLLPLPSPYVTAIPMAAIPRPIQPVNICASRQAARPNTNTSCSGNTTQEFNSKVLSMSMLALMPQKKREEVLGERLLPLVHRILDDANLSYKITGILLECPTTEVLHMLENNECLKLTVNDLVQKTSGPSKKASKK